MRSVGLPKTSPPRVRDSFKFSKYLMFCRLYRDDDPEEEAGQAFATASR